MMDMQVASPPKRSTSPSAAIPAIVKLEVICPRTSVITARLAAQQNGV